MEELMNILKEIDDSIDYAKECALIDDRLLDSFGAESIWKMIKRLQEN